LAADPATLVSPVPQTWRLRNCLVSTEMSRLHHHYEGAVKGGGEMAKYLYLVLETGISTSW